MTCSVGIVGAGAVGRAVATAITAAGVVHDLVLVSRTPDQAQALAIEVNDMAAAARSPVRARAAARVEDLHGTQAAVIAARTRFTTTAPGPEQRLGGLHANAPLIVELGQRLHGYGGFVLVVTNPVDIMTMWAGSGFPRGCGREPVADCAV